MRKGLCLSARVLNTSDIPGFTLRALDCLHALDSAMLSSADTYHSQVWFVADHRVRSDDHVSIISDEVR